MSILSFSRRAALALTALSFAVPAAAATLEVTVTNNFAAGGLSLTPLWGAFHNGSFDAFDAGDPASAGVEQIAELGNPAGLNTILAATDPAGTAISIAQPANGFGTIDPGETATVLVDVDENAARYFSFLAMIVPSNDTFVGNDDATAFALFDTEGSFLGDQLIELTAADLYDAGTEVNDPSFGPAFVVGQDATQGVDEDGVVHAAEPFTSFAGLSTPLGQIDLAAIDFASDPTAFSVATVSVSLVAPVPLPPGAALVLASVGALGTLRARRRRTS